ncbi:MAG: hypothetical protein DHS20C05_19440 [Hyphococcus sp.]|nr:MAG: hypothetical protein DHS20C05_19440 [Marinicaulis sp.]
MSAPSSISSVSKRWLYIPFIIAAIIMTGYFLLWRTGAHEMKKAVYQWVEDQRALGLTVTHGDIDVDGFPFFLRVHIEEPEIAAAGEWRWRSDRLSLDALPYDLNRLIFSPQGEHTVSVHELGEWRGRAEDFRASIARDKQRDWVFSVTLANAVMHNVADGSSAELASLVFDAAPALNDPSTLTLNLAASGLSAQTADAQYNAHDIKTMLTLSQTQALSGFNPARQWRQMGGKLEIIALFADVEDAKIATSGTIGLDAQLYPEGALKTEVQNPAALARLLGKAGALNAEDTEAAAASFTLLAIANGGKIIAPLTLQDGSAEIGGVKITKLRQMPQ